MAKSAVEKQPPHTVEDKKAFGAQLAKARKKEGLSLEGAAEALRKQGYEIGKAAIGHWETGQNLPDALWLRRLARLYKTTSDALLFGGSGVEAGDLTPEVLVLAADLDQLPPKQRNWALRIVKDAVEIAHETLDPDYVPDIEHRDSGEDDYPKRRTG